MNTCIESVEQFGRGQQREPDQTLAFRRVLQTAVLHVQSAGRQEVQSGDVLAAILQQPKSFAAQALEGHGISRLDILELHLARRHEGAAVGRRRQRRRGARGGR